MKNNLSLDRLGARLGRDKSTISRYENGMGNLNTETILAYCKEFGVDPNYILCWKTIPDRKDGLTEERFMNILESYGKSFGMK